METVEVRTEKIDLGGGSVLHVSRFRDPATDRDRLTLVRGFDDRSPLPTDPECMVDLPGGATEELVDALRALDNDAG